MYLVITNSIFILISQIISIQKNINKNGNEVLYSENLTNTIISTHLQTI